MADYNVRYRDASGKLYDNVQSQDEYGRYLDASGNVLGNSGQYQDGGQWSNPQDQSWLDYLGMKGSDVGGAAYNALANITGALSPIGTSEQGNMALQVPPLVTGLIDSGKRIGQQGGFTGVEEFDQQLNQDLSNVVLSLYGGNALAGLSKPRGALGAGAFKEQPGTLATAGEQPKGITAYHGSPHDFDKFSLDAIGTGEGAQAYGHGLYFADSEGVARSYRDALASLPPHGYHAKNDVMAYNGDIDAAIANAERRVQKGDEKYAPVLDYLKTMKDGNDPQPFGKMYQVRINADPESFLDWDKPLSQQPESVRSGISKAAYGEVLPEWTGADAYHSVGSQMFSEPNIMSPEISQRVREAGIPGIRYLDGNSRGSGAGSSNYVVFDDSLIEILKKYGMAGGAVGAGALAQPDNASAQDLPPWLKF